MTAVPAEMRASKRWLLWRHHQNKKPPCDAQGTLLKDWQNPARFLTYDEAVAACLSCEAVDGIGFMLGDGWSGLDLDDCYDADTQQVTHPKAKGILASLPTAYAEQSPSGKGVKLWGHGDGWLELAFKSDECHVKTTGYFTVTGLALSPDRTELPVLPLDRISTLPWGGKTPRLAPGTPKPGERKRAPALPDVLMPGSQATTILQHLGRMRRLGEKPEVMLASLLEMQRIGQIPSDPGREPWTVQDFEAMVRSVSRYDVDEDPFPVTAPGCAEFFQRVAPAVLFDVDRQSWLVFEANTWREDSLETLRAYMLEAMRTRLAIAQRGDSKERIKKLLAFEDKVTPALREAQVLFGCRTADFNRDKFLLGVPNGVVDLRTGELRTGQAADMVSLQAAVSYDPQAKCPLWEQTLTEIFAKDPTVYATPKDPYDLATVPYLQRALGYSLTGDNREEVFFLLTSPMEDRLEGRKPGREGKGTILETVAYVLGQYHENLSFQTLEAKNNTSTTSPDIAKLVQKRMVTASEANTGQRFNEGLIKRLTGRDSVTCRFLYQNEFTFIPEFKLWLAANVPPRVRDEAFWSRPHRIPFNTSFRGRENMDLKDRLRGDAQGILAWLVRGCLAWQKYGLNPPKAITDAVKEYETSQDPLADFYDARCIADPEAITPLEVLRGAYKAWAASERLQYALGMKGFNLALARKYEVKTATVRGVQTKCVHGLRLVTVDREPGSDDDQNLPF